MNVGTFLNKHASDTRRSIDDRKVQWSDSPGSRKVDFGIIVKQQLTDPHMATLPCRSKRRAVQGMNVVDLEPMLYKQADNVQMVI